MFVAAEKALDYKKYHDTLTDVTWETCTLRTWLNDFFYRTAFSADEQKAIVPQDVTNEDHPDPKYGTEGGNDTRDHIYLLSMEEVTDEFYGFCRESSDTEIRVVKETDFSYVRGTHGMGKGDASWRLRSPGIYSDYAAYVDTYGMVDGNGQNVSRLYESAICPVLHIDLDSALWHMSGDDGSKAAEGIPANPIHHCVWDDQTRWSYVNFGNYPQTEIADSALIEVIENGINAAGATEEAQSVDVEITEADGSKTKYRRMIQEGDTGSEYHYFKWEPIRWRVLCNDGNALFVMADQALDCEMRGFEWESCTLRTWLNESFYAAAFSSEEQDAIAEWEVKSTDTFGGNDTKDKIYLLSIAEVTNEAYGFCSDECVDSPSRQLKASDYACAKGTTAPIGDRYHCVWWLCSPGTLECFAGVWHTGCVLRSAGANNGSTMGVSPVLHIDLSSDLWSMAEGENEEAEEEVLTGLRATKIKTVYTQGEEMKLDDLGVTAVYKKSAKVLSPEDYTVDTTGIDRNRPGSYSMEVSYTEGGVTAKASVTITVKEKAEEGTGGNAGGEDGKEEGNPGEKDDGSTDGKEDGRPGEKDDRGSQEKKPVKVTKITITGPSKKLAAGKKIKLTAGVLPKNAANKQITWKTSKKQYATVKQNGTVTLKAAGAGKTVTITATAKDGSKVKGIYKIKIMKGAVKSIRLKAPAKTLKAGKSMKLKATVKTTAKSANKALTWTSSNKKYATVNKSGKVTAKKAGKGKTVTITAAATDGSNKKARIKIRIK